MNPIPNAPRPTDEQLRNAIELLMHSPAASQADGSDGHTAATRLSWPRCYPHYGTCSYDIRCQCPVHNPCQVAAQRLSNAALSLKYYQHLGNDQLSVHHR